MATIINSFSNCFRMTVKQPTSLALRRRFRTRAKWEELLEKHVRH